MSFAVGLWRMAIVGVSSRNFFGSGIELLANFHCFQSLFSNFALWQYT